MKLSQKENSEILSNSPFMYAFIERTSAHLVRNECDMHINAS